MSEKALTAVIQEAYIQGVLNGGVASSTEEYCSPQPRHRPATRLAPRRRRIAGDASRFCGLTGAGATTDDFGGTFTGDSPLVLAFGPSRFDLIVSKCDYGDDLKHNHHVFHRQSRSQSFQGPMSVAGYQMEDEGITLYVVGQGSAGARGKLAQASR